MTAIKTLDDALWVLANCHTEPDPTSGYVAHKCAHLAGMHGHYAEATYLAAWGVVRRHLRLSADYDVGALSKQGEGS